MPVVSVVMPSLNQASFLGDAIRSVLDQGVTDAELIVCDGGSDDGSLELLSDLAGRYRGRFRWSSGPDLGPADAVNTAVRDARAPVIGWLNSDDLYTAGAVTRALQHLVEHPSHVMVYGHGEHVDAAGNVIGAYPSRLPSVPLQEFADGCFICQPTAFFRREAFLALGGLDTRLRAAFDFEFWLRLFRRHPGGIGFIDTVQARSRLHAGSITLRQRERVAMEAMEVIARHVGPAPSHWLLTHVDELCRDHPFGAGSRTLRARVDALIDSASGWMVRGQAQALSERLARDSRLVCGGAHAFLGIHPDGWAPPSMLVRVEQATTPFRRVLLDCRLQAPAPPRLRIEVLAPDGEVRCVDVDGHGRFELSIDVDDRRPGARAIYTVLSDGGFIPAEVEPGSTDKRRLAFRVEACRTV